MHSVIIFSWVVFLVVLLWSDGTAYPFIMRTGGYGIVFLIITLWSSSRKNGYHINTHIRDERQASVRERRDPPVLEHMTNERLSAEVKPSASGIDISNVGIEAEPVISPRGKELDFFARPGTEKQICQGHGFYGFHCCPVKDLSGDCLRQFEALINLSQFDDEAVENNVPVFEPGSPEGHRFTTIIVKGIYSLPNVVIDRIHLDEFCSADYHEKCQPGGVKAWREGIPVGTFRVTKPLIPYIFKVVCQMGCSELNNPDDLRKLASLDGIGPVDKAFLMERTKRDIRKVDSTAKVKSVLMYRSVKGGVLLTNCTVVLVTSIPKTLSAIVASFGTKGAVETAVACRNTRQYYQSVEC